MKRIGFILIATLVGCDGKKSYTESETLYNGTSFNAAGVSKNTVQLGIKLKHDDTGKKAYYVTARNQKSDPSKKDVPLHLLCTFEAEDIAVAREIVSLGRSEVSIVLRESEVIEEGGRKKSHIFLSTDTSDSLKNKTSAELVDSPKTLVLVRNIDKSNKAEAESIPCEFNLLNASEYSQNNMSPQEPLDAQTTGTKPKRLRNLMRK